MTDQFSSDEPDSPTSPTAVAPAVVDASRVESVLTGVHRREWTFVVAATVRTARDLDLAEECVQEAYAGAMTAWSRDGIPANPAAWLITTARRRAIDVIRREQTFRSKLPLLIEPEEDPETVEDTAMQHARETPGSAGEGLELPAVPVAAVADDRLRLIFLCCHPALPTDGQVALTLRLVCGVSTPDIARAFLVSESTMAARITRAKRKIAGSRMPFRMPSGAELPDRLGPVLTAAYLMYTTGHTAPSGPDLLRPDVVDSAIRLGRALHELMPDEVEVAGLLALMLVTDARRQTRVSDTGRLLTLAEQDRSRWNRDQLDEGDALIVAALRRAPGQPGRYTLQAAIASLYAEAASFADTDWPQILYLYDHLLKVWPTPVVALNRVVPLSYVAGPAAALTELEDLENDQRLTTYTYLAAIKADLLTRLDRPEEAADQYRRARDLTDNRAEQDFLVHRVDPT